MTSLIAKAVSKKILGESVANRFGQEDPYFETVPATRLDGRPNHKPKKVRKALPPGLSEHDGKVLTKVKRRAYRLDMSLFSCCGIRFGWSSVVGLIPMAGDALDAFMALMVVHTCKQVEGGLPTDILTRMYINVVLDFFVGLVPFLGDLADAVFRANTRNAVVLEQHLRKKGKQNLRSRGAPVPEVDPSEADTFDRYQSEPPPEYTETQPGRQPEMSSAGHRTQQAGVAPARPSQARTRDDRQGRGSFFGLGRSRSGRPIDEEMGGANGPDSRRNNGRSR